MFIEMDKARFVAIFMAFLSYSQNAFLKWRQGLLDPSLWLGWEQVIMNLVCSPGGMFSGNEGNTFYLESGLDTTGSGVKNLPALGS